MLVPTTSLLPGRCAGTTSCEHCCSFELPWLAGSAGGLLASASRKCSSPQGGVSVCLISPENGFLGEFHLLDHMPAETLAVSSTFSVSMMKPFRGFSLLESWVTGYMLWN